MVLSAAQAGGPAVLVSPDDVLIMPQLVKSFRNRKRLIDATPGFEAAIHRFGLPFHKRESAFRARRFPFVEKVGAVNLRVRVRAGFVRPEGAGNTAEHGLRRAEIERAFKARHVNEILYAAGFPIGR